MVHSSLYHCYSGAHEVAARRKLITIVQSDIKDRRSSERPRRCTNGKTDSEWYKFRISIRKGIHDAVSASRVPRGKTITDAAPRKGDACLLHERQPPKHKPPLRTWSNVLESLDDPLFELGSENCFARGIVFVQCDNCGANVFPNPDWDHKAYWGHTCESKLEAARDDYSDGAHGRDGCSTVRLYWASEALWYPALHAATKEASTCTSWVTSSPGSPPATSIQWRVQR